MGYYEGMPKAWADIYDDCANCHKSRSEFPMAFRQDPYCSDNCRKALNMDLER